VRFFVLPTYRWADPALAGVLMAAAAYFIVLTFRRDSRNVGSVQSR
jgi:hypothetical protein